MEQFRFALAWTTKGVSVAELVASWLAVLKDHGLNLGLNGEKIDHFLFPLFRFFACEA
jgi:hypothetical protein